MHSILMKIGIMASSLCQSDGQVEVLAGEVAPPAGCPGQHATPGARSAGGELPRPPRSSAPDSLGPAHRTCSHKAPLFASSICPTPHMRHSAYNFRHIQLAIHKLCHIGDAKQHGVAYPGYLGERIGGQAARQASRILGGRGGRLPFPFLQALSLPGVLPFQTEFTAPTNLTSHIAVPNSPATPSLHFSVMEK